MATITYPYWRPIEGLKSGCNCIDILQDVKNFSQGHSWYKLYGGRRMKCYITFNSTRYDRNPGYNDQDRYLYVWFMQDWRIQEESQEAWLTAMEIDGWWNPRNYPNSTDIPVSFSQDPARQEEFLLLKSNEFRSGVFRWVETLDEYIRIAYQHHRIYVQSKDITIAAEKAFWLMRDEIRLTVKWMARYLCGLPELAQICIGYLEPNHFRCYDNHKAR